MTKFFVFSGRKQTGKDAAALIAKKVCLSEGYDVTTFPFAKTLKDMVHSVFGVSLDLLYGTDEHKETLTHLEWDGFPMAVRLDNSNDSSNTETGNPAWGQITVPRSGHMTVREILQVVGTDIFRNHVYSRVWAEAPFRQEWMRNDAVLIPDCRFPDEVLVSEEHEAHVLRIERDTGLEDEHESETALDGYSFKHVYHNSGTLEELIAFVEGFVQERL